MTDAKLLGRKCLSARPDVLLLDSPPISITWSYSGAKQRGKGLAALSLQVGLSPAKHATHRQRKGSQAKPISPTAPQHVILKPTTAKHVMIWPSSNWMAAACDKSLLRHSSPTHAQQPIRKAAIALVSGLGDSVTENLSVHAARAAFEYRCNTSGPSRRPSSLVHTMPMAPACRPRAMMAVTALPKHCRDMQMPQEALHGLIIQLATP